MAKVFKVTPLSSAGGLSGIDRELDDEQRAVVKAPRAPLLVVAGPGSGKTRTITARVSRWLHNGANPQRILLLTFTRAAAREMIRRVEAQSGMRLYSMPGGTFHSTAARLLQQYGSYIGLSDNFTILDMDDAQSLMKDAFNATERPARVRLPQPKSLISIWSMARNTMRTVADVLDQHWHQFRGTAPILDSIFDEFQRQKMSMQCVDYDDLLTGWYQLLRDHPEGSAKIRRLYDDIVVDEFQDINTLQNCILEEMAKEHRSLTVVGDDGQAIYGFRGADYRNMVEFKARFPEAEVLHLQRNYRSTPQIVSLANLTLAAQTTPFPRQLRSTLPDGPLPVIVRCPNEDLEAAFVVQRIKELLGEEVSPSEIAVLFRAQKDSARVEAGLASSGIHYIVRAGLKFFEKRHIKDLLAFLRIIHNPTDLLAWRRCLVMADRVGPVTANKLYGWVMASGGEVSSLERPDWINSVPRQARPNLEPLRRLLLLLDQPSMRSDPAKALQTARDSFYDSWLKLNTDRSENRLAELDTLVSWAGQFHDYASLLDALAIEPQLEGVDNLASPKELADPITLSTVHQAKGLEFKVVFVIGLAADRFPRHFANNSREDMEEEQRIFYVAITRAKSELMMSYPQLITASYASTRVSRMSPFIARFQNKKPPLCEEWRVEV